MKPRQGKTKAEGLLYNISDKFVCFCTNSSSLTQAHLNFMQNILIRTDSNLYKSPYTLSHSIKATHRVLYRLF